jgi:hypothetical protein
MVLRCCACPRGCPPVDGFHVDLLFAVDCDEVIIPQHHCFWWLARWGLLCNRRQVRCAMGTPKVRISSCLAEQPSL